MAQQKYKKEALNLTIVRGAPGHLHFNKVSLIHELEPVSL